MTFAAPQISKFEGSLDDLLHELSKARTGSDKVHCRNAVHELVRVEVERLELAQFTGHAHRRTALGALALAVLSWVGFFFVLSRGC